SKYNKAKTSKSNATKVVKESHEKFKKDIIKMKNNNIKLGEEFFTVFNGIELKLPGKDVESLLKSDEVKAVHLNEVMQLELPQEIKDTSLAPSPYMADSLEDIGVDKLHEEGITGKGIKVGVLDTGIDYNHPDLKDNYKGGWDCIDEDNDPMETTYEDWKASGKPEFSASGSSYYTSHGTHVSGTIGATKKNDSDFAVKGVAPDADIYGYRVLGPYGSGMTADIIQAIELSVQEELDVINLSLGSKGANVNDPLSIACNNAMIAGVVTVTSNGNSGPNISTVGTPAASALAISVGASTTSITLPVFDINIDGENIDGLTFSRNYKNNISNIDGKSLDIVDCGLGNVADFENKDVSGKVVLIQRGGLSFNDKLINAQKAGAEFAIIYNNVDGEIPYYIGESNDFVSSLALTKLEGEQIKAKLEENKDLQISFKSAGETQTQKDLLADFSSRGPVPSSVEIKPDITAPGVSIISTYPEFIGDKNSETTDYEGAYGRISGTSMASPHVAGIAALIVQENENIDPFDVKLNIMNTADDLVQDYGVNEVGAGRIDAYQAVKADASIRHEAITIVENSELAHNTGSVSFGRKALEEGTNKFEEELVIKNNTNKTTTLDVSVEYVSADKSHGGKDAVKNNVKMNTRDRVVVSRNQETKLKLALTVPQNAEAGLYQGYINLQDTRNKDNKYQIPFSIKVSKPGVEYIAVDRKAISNDKKNIFMPEGVAGLNAQTRLSGEMKGMHIIVKDYKTKEVLGYSNSFDLEGKTYERDLFLPFVLTTSTAIYPYEDGEFKSYKKDLKEGSYEIEFVAEDLNGKYYTMTDSVMIENTPVENNMHINGNNIENKSQIIEVNDSMYKEETAVNGNVYDAIWLKGTLYDSTIDKLKEIGEGKFDFYNREVSQLDNEMRGYPDDNLMDTMLFTVNEDGSYKVGFTKDDFENDGKIKFSMRSYDMAHSKDHRVGRVGDRHLLLVEEGRTFVDSEYNTETMRVNEINTHNIKLNNANNFTRGNFKMTLEKQFEVVDVRLSEDIKDKFDINHTINEVNGKYELDINIESKDGNKLNGDLDLMDIDIKLADDSSANISATPLSYKSVSFANESSENNEGYFLDAETFVLTDSSADIRVSGEALRSQGKLEPSKYEKNVVIKDETGNEYTGEYDTNLGNKNGYMNYMVKGLPIGEYIEITTEVPGHFPTKTIVNTGKEINEVVHSKHLSVDEEYAEYGLAGDVNSDDKIDELDVKLVEGLMGQKYTNTKEVEADLNQDGIVNEKDMKFVKANIGKVNPLSK
ncbi:MAG: S8 family serine peptidase, partial [Peptostreptococcaceae bacterium]